MQAKWRWIAAGGFAVCVLAALRLIGPSVPNEIRLLTGPEGSTFHEDGLRYKEMLGRHGVVVHVEPTAGSLENVSLLVKAEAPTAGFVQGVREEADREEEVPEGLESLGTVDLQPLWVFVKKGMDPTSLRDLTGSRIAAGEKGSDPRLLAVLLLRGEGVQDSVSFAPGDSLDTQDALEAFRAGQLAAVIAAGGPDSELIDNLLRAPALDVVSIRRADAFAVNHRFLEKVSYPEGAHDLRANIPDKDLELVAARVQLVVTDPFPPALADLLLQAATEIHGESTPFSAPGEFPNANTAAMPLNRAAEGFYTEGPPRLQQYLPFRLATWIDRLVAAAVAIASAAVAIFKIVPALIALPFQLKVRKALQALEGIERDAAAGVDQEPLLERLAEQDRITAEVQVPMQDLTAEWLELRQALHDARERVEGA